MVRHGRPLLYSFLKCLSFFCFSTNLIFFLSFFLSYFCKSLPMTFFFFHTTHELVHIFFLCLSHNTQIIIIFPWVPLCWFNFGIMEVVLQFSDKCKSVRHLHPDCVFPCRIYNARTPGSICFYIPEYIFKNSYVFQIALNLKEGVWFYHKIWQKQHIGH